MEIGIKRAGIKATVNSTQSVEVYITTPKSTETEITGHEGRPAAEKFT